MLYLLTNNFFYCIKLTDQFVGKEVNLVITRPMVRIVSRPRGDAPEWVRDAWIGVDVPLSPDHQNEGPQLYTGSGVYQDPGKYQLDSYRVLSMEAIDALAQKDSRAANWWKQNTHFYDPRGSFLFDASSCQLVE